jgi:hypothetical protein
MDIAYRSMLELAQAFKLILEGNFEQSSNIAAKIVDNTVLEASYGEDQAFNSGASKYPILHATMCGWLCLAHSYLGRHDVRAAELCYTAGIGSRSGWSTFCWLLSILRTAYCRSPSGEKLADCSRMLHDHALQMNDDGENGDWKWPIQLAKSSAVALRGDKSSAAMIFPNEYLDIAEPCTRDTLRRLFSPLSNGEPLRWDIEDIGAWSAAAIYIFWDVNEWNARIAETK